MGDTDVSIITIASSKGGAGKTTISRLLLGHAARQGLRAAALDADLNHSLKDWIGQHRAPFEVREEIDETKIVSAIGELDEQNDLVVVDTAGAATQADDPRDLLAAAQALHTWQQGNTA